MKQQVNFYAEEFQPKRDWVSARMMLLYWLAGCVLVSMLYPFEAKKLELAERNMLMAQQQEDRLLRQLNELQASFSERGDAEALERELEQKTRELLQRQQVLTQLGLRTEGMERGVAGILDDLARHPIEGLWLSEINVYQGQLSVTGFTLEADHVPLLVAQLQKIGSLKERRFSKLVIKQSEEPGLLGFSIQSEMSGGTSASAGGQGQ